MIVTIEDKKGKRIKIDSTYAKSLIEKGTWTMVTESVEKPKQKRNAK